MRKGHRNAWRAGAVLLWLALVASVTAGCGGNGDKTSVETLKDRLPPASAVPGKAKILQSYEWDNTVDAVAQGVFYSESTAPSELVKAFDEGGFNAGAGERLKSGDTDAEFLAIALGSESDARDVLERLHTEDLKQPCFPVCSAEATELTVKAIPGAKAVRQSPVKKLPPDAPPPFLSYAVEFVVGDVLYIGYAGGPPKSIKEAQFAEVAKAFYDGVTGNSSGRT